MSLLTCCEAKYVCSLLVFYPDLWLISPQSTPEALSPTAQVMPKQGSPHPKTTIQHQNFSLPPLPPDEMQHSNTTSAVLWDVVKHPKGSVFSCHMDYQHHCSLHLLQVQQPDLNFALWEEVGMRGATLGMSHPVWGDIPVSQQTSPYPSPLYSQDHFPILLCYSIPASFPVPQGSHWNFAQKELEKLIPGSFIPPLLLSSSLPCHFA